MPREKRAANASSKREKAELAELAERVLSEALARTIILEARARDRKR